ncbi:MAG: ABC transporter permease [Actinomycetota bacterium]
MAGRGGSVREPRGLILPAWAYYLLFFVAPMLIIIPYALAHREGFFDITFGFDTENLRKLWDPVYIRIYRDTLIYAALGTVGCLLIGYPFAYWLGTRVTKHKTLLLLLVIVPFWTSILIRTQAWSLILDRFGILGTDTAVFIGLVYDYLPLMIFPLYVSIERMDRRLVEASRDLGESAWGSFRKVTVPMTMPGIMTGCLLVFVPMTGEYVVPTILGQGLGRWFGPIAADQFLSALNYPFGAAMSLVMIVFLMIVIFLYLRALGGRAEENLGAAV